MFPLPEIILLLAMVKVLLIGLVERQKVLTIRFRKSLRSKFTPLMDKEKLQTVENLDLWSVSLDVKGISNAHVAVMNADEVLRICHNGLDTNPPILNLAYEQSLIFQKHL